MAGRGRGVYSRVAGKSHERYAQPLLWVPTEAYSGCFVHHCMLKNDVEWDASDHNRLKSASSVLLGGEPKQRKLPVRSTPT